MKKEFKVSMTDDEIMSVVLEYLSVSKRYYIDNIKPKFSRFYDLYNGVFDYKLNNSPDGTYVSKDIQVAIHSVIPDLIKLVFTDEPVKLSPQGGEDVELANNLQALLNYQITNQNEYTEIMEKVSLQALITGMGILKCVWDKKVVKNETTAILTLSEVNTLTENNIEIKECIFSGVDEYNTEYYDVTYLEDQVVRNQPVYFNVDYRELFYDVTAKNIDDVNYYIHRKLVTLDFIKSKADAGIFNKDVVKKIINKNYEVLNCFVNSYDEDDNLDYTNYSVNNENNKPLDKVMLYEFWGKIDINQDGYLEDVVITFVGNNLLSVQENKYSMYPFFIFNPFYDTEDITGIGIAELIEPMQNIKTVLTREYLLNVRKNNNRKIFYKLNNFINPIQLETDEQFIALNEDADPRNVFNSEPFEAFSTNTQNLITYFDTEAQRISGISDIKGGVRQTGSQTATEATIMFEASNSKIQLIATHFCTTMKKLYKFIIYQNKQYLDNSITLRLFNRDIIINPLDFSNVDFDLDISVNLGSGTKQSRIMSYQQAYKMLGELKTIGVTDDIKIRNLAAKMLEEIGLKDTDSYLVSENELIERFKNNQANQANQMINQTPQNQLGNIEVDEMNKSADKLPLEVR